MPNGVASSVPSSFVPTIDHRTIGMVKTSATRKRLRMSRSIASIDMPAWPPWPCAVRVVGALDVAAWSCAAVVGLDQRVADVAGHRLAGAVVAALLAPSARRSSTEVCAGSKVTVAVWATGLASTASTPGPVAEHLLDDGLLAGVVQAADVQDRRLIRGCGGGAHGFQPSTRGGYVKVCVIPQRWGPDY